MNKTQIRAAKLKSLYDNIYSTSMEQYGAYSYVVYLHGKKTISIGSYKDIMPYSAQVTGNNEFKVGFSDTKNKTQVIFTTNVDAKKEDRDSYNKYGGLIYIFEPITDKIASEIMKKVPYLNRLNQYKKPAKTMTKPAVKVKTATKTARKVIANRAAKSRPAAVKVKTASKTARKATATRTATKKAKSKPTGETGVLKYSKRLGNGKYEYKYVKKR